MSTRLRHLGKIQDSVSKVLTDFAKLTVVVVVVVVVMLKIYDLYASSSPAGNAVNSCISDVWKATHYRATTPETKVLPKQLLASPPKNFEFI
jgi:hypothetical protein